MQLKYSPRNVPGFGLSDGEVVERLWSYLRRFSRMSKEMRPSHRLDVICDALYHYCRKSHDHLGMLSPYQVRMCVDIVAYSYILELKQISGSVGYPFETYYLD